MSTIGPRLHNTLSRTRETLEPIAPPRVQIYACGPTVYDHPHIGNFRYFVWTDVVHRFLQWRGYDVDLVMNLTDIDDKIIERAEQAGVSIGDLAEKFIRAFHDGLETLRILPAASYPRATEHIAEMVDLIEKLLTRDHAYVVEGNVFFRVASFEDYGQLTHLVADELQTTDRVQGDEFGKRDPRDFALWKAVPPGEPNWDAPFGAGRPGWHLECSAMSMAAFGGTFDLHLGGADLAFPHHENEIAQSESATNETFVKYWMHCQHLIVDGAKMSKSLGNFKTLAELEAAGNDPAAIRYLLLSVHYRRQLNFTDEALEQAHAAVQRLRETYRRLEERIAERRGEASPTATERLERALHQAERDFAAALDDDLNTSGALGHLFLLVRELNAVLDLDGEPPGLDLMIAVRAWLRSIDEILAVFEAPTMSVSRQHEDTELQASGPPIDATLADLVLDRIVARREKDFGLADTLRDQLKEVGIEVEDAGDAARWKLLTTTRST
ncbi:MAG: cysteine--tRNA ligase [Acidobacteria bacterium]|nr:cysteine--tRNA ligase [Acidobacteriota bacterium]